MRKSIKSFITIFTLVLGIFQISTMVFAKTDIPSAKSNFYVNDFAEVFSDTEEARLMDNAVTLSNEHDGIQVVVTTVKSLDGSSIEDYALAMYNQYEIGKDDMGLLILLSTGDRQIRVEVGKAMEAYINDSKSGRFIDKYAIPSLKENKFNEGLINLQEAFISEIITCVDSETAKEIAGTNSSDINLGVIFFPILFILAGILLIILIIYIIRKIIQKINERKEIINNLTSELETTKKMAITEREKAQATITSLRQDYNELVQKTTEETREFNLRYTNLEKNFSTLKDRYERVNKLYPNVDAEVTAMIENEIREFDMKKAEEIDSLVQGVINLLPNKDIVDNLRSILSSYYSLTKAQKSYIKSDIQKLNQLYDESVALKEKYEKKLKEEKNKKIAAVAVVSITGIIAYISYGKARDLNKLKRAKNIYENLNSEAKKYVDESVIDKLERLIKEAKRDKEEEEEAERQRKKREEEARRRRMNNNSSGFGGSFGGGFGGFGGHSGGGGASRRF